MICYFWIKFKVTEIIITFVVIKINQYEDRIIYPCYINAVYPEVGVASYKLLKSLGLDVDYPLDQTCCGQPMANAGFEHESAGLALRMEELFRSYDYVVGPSASCVAFVKENHPGILKRQVMCV